MADPVPPRLYLDDLSVGDRFRSATHALSEEDIKGFARVYDPQPFHLDDTAARQTLFGGLAASGWHTAAITMRLLVDGGLPLSSIIGLGGELSWPNPARPGDVLHVETTIQEILPSRSKPDRGVVQCECTTLNQRGDVVQILRPKLMVFRRPAA